MPVEEKLSPNYTKLDSALRSIGYSFEVAVADIIDNSIDAQAKQILVRLVMRKSEPLDLVIYDDGEGMDESTLREAMRFGADVSEHIDRLGKFGLGLKLASLSQAREVRVYSRRVSHLSGRGWLEHGITRGFTSSIFDESECLAQLRELQLEKQLRSCGTAVLWSRLYRLGHSHSTPEEHVQQLINRLRNYLSLAFHRFLSGRARRVAITIDALDVELGQIGIPVIVNGLDPFGYSVSGNKEFPQQLLLEGYDQALRMIAHIWPPNVKQPEYKLPGGANARQGFYFYRNDRLIQGGGWNGLREAEPHSSLVRLEVDISPQFDLEVSLDVKKIEVQLPVPLIKAIQGAKTRLGVDFKKYLRSAEQTYRLKSLQNSEIPIAMGKGIPKMLQHTIIRELGLNKTGKVRKLKFEWGVLEEDYLFDVDRDRDVIILNREYRRHLLHGLSGSSTDIPVTKCLLFLLLTDVFHSERIGSRVREKLDQANRILLAAVKYERT